MQNGDPDVVIAEFALGFALCLAGPARAPVTFVANLWLRSRGTRYVIFYGLVTGGLITAAIPWLMARRLRRTGGARSGMAHQPSPASSVTGAVAGFSLLADHRVAGAGRRRLIPPGVCIQPSCAADLSRPHVPHSGPGEGQGQRVMYACEFRDLCAQVTGGNWSNALTMPLKGVKESVDAGKGQQQERSECTNRYSSHCRSDAMLIDLGKSACRRRQTLSRHYDAPGLLCPASHRKTPSPVAHNPKEFAQEAGSLRQTSKASEARDHRHGRAPTVRRSRPSLSTRP